MWEHVSCKVDANMIQCHLLAAIESCRVRGCNRKLATEEFVTAPEGMSKWYSRRKRVLRVMISFKCGICRASQNANSDEANTYVARVRSLSGHNRCESYEASNRRYLSSLWGCVVVALQEYVLLHSRGHYTLPQIDHAQHLWLLSRSLLQDMHVALPNWDNSLKQGQKPNGEERRHAKAGGAVRLARAQWEAAEKYHDAKSKVAVR